MYTFNEFVLMMEAFDPNEPPPEGVDPQTWQYASERMRNYLRTQAQGSVPQAPPKPEEAPATYKVAAAPRGVARALGSVRGQTGQGLESIASGGRVPPDLVSQIPPEDIAPSWYTATKYYKGRDGRVYKK